MPIQLTRLAVSARSEPVPTLLAEREGAPPDQPLLLFGHGANTGKDDEIMQLLVRTLAERVGAAVAIIDCPDHGERRAPGLTDEEAEAQVQRSIADPATTDQLVDEWSAVLTAARPAASGPVGYVGFSMGAVYGLSIVHALADVRTSVFALGGLLDETVAGNSPRNAHVRSGAQMLGDRETLMINMTHDEHFALPGALEVLDLIPGPRRMLVYPGRHAEIPPEAIGQAVRFLSRTLDAR